MDNKQLAEKLENENSPLEFYKHKGAILEALGLKPKKTETKKSVKKEKEEKESEE